MTPIGGACYPELVVRPLCLQNINVHGLHDAVLGICAHWLHAHDNEASTLIAVCCAGTYLAAADEATSLLNWVVQTRDVQLGY